MALIYENLINSVSLSYSAIKTDLEDYIKSKPDYQAWRDFYESGQGQSFIELIAALGTYIAYQNIIARREAYLVDAKIRSSNIAIAEGLGYPSYRGQNVHLDLTITPDQTISLERYTIIGAVAGYDLVLAEDITLSYGVQTDFEVILGFLKEEDVEVQSSDLNVFRFISEKVSEDYQLFLNEVELPVSKDIINLDKDYYVVLSNGYLSVDAYYINKLQPTDWQSNTSYIPGTSITPSFEWRSSTTYSIDDMITPTESNINGYHYKCISSIEPSQSSEPIWPTSLGSTVIDGGITWENVGVTPEDLYFESVQTAIGLSGSIEPIWTMVIGETVIDNTVEWKCVKDLQYSNYQYNTGDTLKLKYIELADITYSESDLVFDYGVIDSYTVTNNFSDIETIESIKVNAPLYHETSRSIRGRNDYLKEFKNLLIDASDTNGRDISPAVVELTYSKNTTTKLWTPRTLINISEQIMPSTPNNYIYENISTEPGYTASDLSGESGTLEPTWPIIIGQTVIDNIITWECKALIGTPSAWQPSTLYNLNDQIIPNTPNGFMYEATSFNVEPIWPIVIGSTVVDNQVTWETVDTIYYGSYDSELWKPVNPNFIGDIILPVTFTGYIYEAQNNGVTGTSEPIFPTTIGDTIVDGTITWLTLNRYDADIYELNNAQRELESYRGFGVEPPLIDNPVILLIGLGITIYLNDTSISDTTIENDVDLILEEYEKILGNSLDIVIIEHAIERLDYVSIARVTIVSENKSVTWQEGILYRIRDVVVPPIPNNFKYEGTFIKDGVDEGYSQWNNKGYSGYLEPTWPLIVSNTIIENIHLEWTCQTLIGTPGVWVSDTIYEIGDIVKPITPNGFMYELTNIVDIEPIWPTTLGESVIDNEVWWKTRDFLTFIPKCDWNEYYIFNRTITTTSVT